MIHTHSKWYFGYDIDQLNFALDFDEGGDELNADVETGAYSLTQFVDAIGAAMNAVGGQIYTVSVDRATRKITISAPGNFTLRIATGSRLGESIYETMGFTVVADVTGDNEYTAPDVCGSEYSTQRMLQAYVDSEDQEGAVDGVVKKAASGKVEVVTYGEENFMECVIDYVTNRPFPPGYVIRNRPTGKEDLRTFLRFLTTKKPVEFMPDEDAPDAFTTFLLESTPEHRDGLKFKLKEMYSEGLVEFYTSGLLTFREITE